ncbi:MAG TPA: phasin family protein [Thermohalobaculum sp.]|nr:phasin family protein [Thermohalobaculum sp.]
MEKSSKATESMSAEIAARSKRTYKDNLAVAKDLIACTSVNEFVEKQMAFGRTSVEGFVAEATKLKEMHAATAKETFVRLNPRVTTAVEASKDSRA